MRLKPASEAEGRRFNSCRARQIEKMACDFSQAIFVWLASLMSDYLDNPMQPL
tara:strand:- start:4 stop:162 length:159 start_codon:yes stop_codon:yes gene_type:complete